MDKIPLITELNDKTRQKDEFELALERSGFSLPSDDEGMDDDMGDMDDMEADDDMDIDTGDEEGYTSDTGLEDDEIQEIVDWCEEECSDLSDEELEDTLRDELEEVDIEPEQMDAAIDRVMSMLGRGSDEEDMDDEGMDDEEGFGDEEGMGDEDEFPPEENEEDLPIDISDPERDFRNLDPARSFQDEMGDHEFDPETDFRPEEDPDAEFEFDPADFRDETEDEFVVDPKKHFRDYVRGEEDKYK